MESPELAEALKNAGFAEYVDIARKDKGEIMANWPKDRLVFISDDSLYVTFFHVAEQGDWLLNRICVVVNGRNHLRIVSKVVENKLKEAYGKLVEVHNLIGAKAKYASDPKFGFLVNSPEEIGAGGFGIELERKEDGKKIFMKAKFGAGVTDTVTEAIAELTKK